MLKRLSSKGQLVLPAAYRKRMGLDTGSRIRVVEDGQRLILEPVGTRQARFVTVKGCQRPILSIIGREEIEDSELIDPLDDDA
jgi:AbrB family looped-hinge helix DNA binding protein